jgi:hypothetical protein
VPRTTHKHKGISSGNGIRCFAGSSRPQGHLPRLISDGFWPVFVDDPGSEGYSFMCNSFMCFLVPCSIRVCFDLSPHRTIGPVLDGSLAGVLLGTTSVQELKRPFMDSSGPGKGITHGREIRPEGANHIENRYEICQE